MQIILTFRLATDPYSGGLKVINLSLQRYYFFVLLFWVTEQTYYVAKILTHFFLFFHRLKPLIRTPAQLRNPVKCLTYCRMLVKNSRKTVTNTLAGLLPEKHGTSSSRQLRGYV